MSTPKGRFGLKEGRGYRTIPCLGWRERKEGG